MKRKQALVESASLPAKLGAKGLLTDVRNILPTRRQNLEIRLA